MISSLVVLAVSYVLTMLAITFGWQELAQISSYTLIGSAVLFVGLVFTKVF